MTISEPLLVTLAITNIFEKLGIVYVVGGSLASSLHGIPRATQDVDIIADIQPRHIVTLLQEMASGWHVDEKLMREALLHHSSFNVIHLESMYKVDVFILKDDLISSQEMNRRQKYQLSDEIGNSIYVATAEDIILQKLLWYEKGGKVSERQWNDAMGVTNIQKNSLDIAYLTNAAPVLGIVNLLEKLLTETGLCNLSLRQTSS